MWELPPTLQNHVNPLGEQVGLDMIKEECKEVEQTYNTLPDNEDDNIIMLIECDKKDTEAS